MEAWGEEVMIQQFDDFMSSRIEQVINDDPQIVIRRERQNDITILFGHPHLDRPNIFPCDARSNLLSYSVDLYVDITMLFTRAAAPPLSKTFPRVLIAQLPVVLHSNICHLHNKTTQELTQLGEFPTDPGAYFIIKGNEYEMRPAQTISTSSLLTELFRKTYALLRANVHNYIQKVLSKSGRRLDLPKAVSPDIIISCFELSISTGNWIKSNIAVTQPHGRYIGNPWAVAFDLPPAYADE